MNEEYIHLKLYFDSNQEKLIKIEENSFKQLKEFLKTNWDIVFYMNEDYGINFSHVTHFEIFE